MSEATETTEATETGSLSLVEGPVQPESAIYESFRLYCMCNPHEPHEWDQSQDGQCPRIRLRAVKFVACKFCPTANAQLLAQFAESLAHSSKPKRSRLPGLYKFLGSTSNMRDHIRTNHSDAFAESNKTTSRQLQLCQPATTKSMKDSDPRKHSIDLQLLKLIFGKKLSLSIVESPEFRSYTTALNPSYKLPCRKTLSSMLHSRCSVVSDLIRADLKSALAISFTCDGWSEHRQYFLGVTVHYVTSNAQFKSNVLPMTQSAEKHTSDTLLCYLETTLGKFLQDDVGQIIGGLTTDTASNMVKLGHNVKMFWAPCFAHVINLIVKDVFELDAFRLPLDNLRKLVTRFRKSHSYIQQLKKVQRDAQCPEKALILDVSTRWNSTYSMCARAIEEKEHIQLALVHLKDEESLVGRNEWTIIAEISKIFVWFETATVACSSESEVTISQVIPFVKLFYQKFQPCSKDTAGERKLKAAIMDRLPDRCDAFLHPESVHSLATAFDHRVKALVQQETWDHLTRLLQQSELGAVLPEPEQHESTNDGEFVGKRAKLSGVSELFSSLPDMVKARQQADSTIPTIEKQLEEYKSSQDSNLLNPIEFWIHQGKRRFPALAQLALRVLSMQATEVPSERSFSSAGQFFTDTRNKLSGDELNHLLFLFCNDRTLVGSKFDMDDVV